MDPNLLKVFRKSTILASLDTPTLVELFRDAPTHTYKGGQSLFLEGDVGSGFLVLTRGWVELSRQTPGGRLIVIGKAGPGEVLGEMALIDPGPRSASALALSSVTTVTIPTDRFEMLIDQGSPAAMALMKALNQVLSARLRECAARTVAELETQPAQSAGDDAGSRVSEGGTEVPLFSSRASARSGGTSRAGARRNRPYASDVIATRELDSPFPEQSAPDRNPQPSSGSPRKSPRGGSLTEPEGDPVQTRRQTLWRLLWGLKG